MSLGTFGMLLSQSCSPSKRAYAELPRRAQKGLTLAEDSAVFLCSLLHYLPPETLWAGKGRGLNAQFLVRLCPFQNSPL